jgi:hypothetical protein
MLIEKLVMCGSMLQVACRGCTGKRGAWRSAALHEPPHGAMRQIAPGGQVVLPSGAGANSSANSSARVLQ